jgi:hypothetical protein
VICPVCDKELEVLAAIVKAPDGTVYHSGCAPLRVIAAQVAPGLAEQSICFACAEKKGGVIPDPYVVTSWIAFCIICAEATGCTHVRDFKWPSGARPTRITT